MAEDAANLYEGGRYEQARELFQRANALYSAPALQLWEARSLEKLGRLVEAEELYSAVARYQVQPEDARIVHDVVRDASAELAEIRARIPTITVVLRGLPPNSPRPQVQLDTRPLDPASIGFPIPVDAGTRVVRLIANGRELVRVDVTLAEGDRKPVELDATGVAQPTTFSSGQAPRGAASDPRGPSSGGESGRITEVHAESSLGRTIGWIGAGAGMAGLIVGSVTGLVAVRKHSSLEEHCPEHECAPEYDGELASFRAYRTASTLSYVIGGIGVVAGVTLLLTVPSSSHGHASASVSLRVTPASAALGGRF